MLPGVSALGFFYNKSERRWNSADIKDYMIRVPYTDLPAFSILVDVGDVSTTATMKIFSTKEVQLVIATSIFVGRSDGLASTGGTGQKSVTFSGQSINDIDSGYYYYEITLSSGLKIYSEVFMVVDSVTGLFGISFQPTDVLINRNFTLPLHLISSTKFYLPFNSITISSEIKEEGVEKSYGNIPVYATANVLYKAELLGTESIFIMLSYLRIILINGVVSLKLNESTANIYDTSVESKDDSGLDSIVISFTYRKYNFISSKNAV